MNNLRQSYKNILNVLELFFQTLNFELSKKKTQNERLYFDWR